MVIETAMDVPMRVLLAVMAVNMEMPVIEHDSRSHERRAPAVPNGQRGERREHQTLGDTASDHSERIGPILRRCQSDVLPVTRRLPCRCRRHASQHLVGLLRVVMRT